MNHNKMQAVTFTSNNVNKKCRCCLKEGIHFLSYEQHKEKFRESLNLLLTSDPRLPQLMCKSCVDTFIEVNEFRDMVIATERQLLEALESNTYYDSVCNNEPVQDSFNVKEESDIETDGDNYEDEASVYQPSDVPSSDDADVDEKVKIENEESSVMIGSTVVKRIVTRRASRATDETKTQHRTSPRKIDLKSDETKPNRKRKNPPSVQSGEMSDSESDAPLSDVKKKNNQMNKKVIYSVTEWNKSNISTGKIQIPKTLEKLEPNLPKSIMINTKLFVKANIKIRQNIVLTLQNSTIIPFRTHAHNPYNYKCYYCQKLFQKINELRKHTESEHVGKVSDKELVSLMNYRSHTLVNADISIVKCRLCDQQSRTVETFIEHLTKVHKKIYHDTDMKGHGIFGFDLSSDELKCNLCAKKFARFLKLSSHMNKHYKNYICSVCGRTYATELRYNEHLKVHRDRKIQCEHCDASFSSKTGFRYHMQRQHFNGAVKCNKCPETFTKYNMKDKHMRETHGIEKTRNLQCDLCQNGTVFTKYGLYRHKMYACPLRKHIPSIVCEICGYKTEFNYTMKQHMDVHNGVKNFACEICAKKFGKRTTLNMHLRMHNKDKRFVCTICDASFVQKNGLNFHMKSKHKG